MRTYLNPERLVVSVIKTPLSQKPKPVLYTRKKKKKDYALYEYYALYALLYASNWNVSLKLSYMPGSAAWMLALRP